MYVMLLVSGSLIRYAKDGRPQMVTPQLWRLEGYLESRQPDLTRKIVSFYLNT